MCEMRSGTGDVEHTAACVKTSKLCQRRVTIRFAPAAGVGAQPKMNGTSGALPRGRTPAVSPGPDLREFCDDEPMNRASTGATRGKPIRILEPAGVAPVRPRPQI